MNRSGVKYSKLRTSEEQYEPGQWKKPPVKVPWESIALAVVLFLLGTTFLSLAIILRVGVIHSEFWEHCYPLFFLGCLLFIPGAYHVRIAYYAYKGYQGFSYADIPSYDD
ncbi:transmembrane protein 230-like isoform X2 [Sycon ciliatum]|uniref:transmembrane protein 230-like isoform X2 n=1 Tax=Sycon ciliatum TaxID=27933 RepID=UPI0020AD2D53|eukprot:scpid80135/ scgid17208/ Transmembrane protein 230